MFCWGILYCRFLICLYFFNKLNDFLYRIEVNYVIKRHWAIENSLHYVLDVTFKEDSCRIREQQATKNMALFRRASVSLINLNST